MGKHQAYSDHDLFLCMSVVMYLENEREVFTYIWGK